MASDFGDLTWEPVALPMVIEPGQSRALTVKYAPSTVQDLTAQLAVHSDDPESPALARVHLQAQRVSVALDFDPRPGDQTQRTLEGLRKNQRFPVQIFSTDLPLCTGYSLDLKFDGAYLGFRNFEKGGVIPQGVELSRPTDSGAVVGVVSLERRSGKDKAGESNLLGTVYLQVRRNFRGTARIALSSLLLNVAADHQEVIPLSFETQVKGRAEERSADFNGDGRIDFYDFFLFGAAFGQEVNGENEVFNLNGDRKIDFGDFAIFADAFNSQRQAKLLSRADGVKEGRNGLARFVLYSTARSADGDGVMRLQIALNHSETAKGYGLVLYYDQDKYEVLETREVAGILEEGNEVPLSPFLTTAQTPGQMAVASMKANGQSGFDNGPLVEFVFRTTGGVPRVTDFRIDEGVLIDGEGGINAVPSELSREATSAPPQSALGQNAPNPFNSSTTISYQVQEPGKVSLVICNLLGQPVRVLVPG